MKDLILLLMVVVVTCCQLVFGENEGAMAANDFAADFSNAVMEKTGANKNLFFSPISVYLAFAMTYAGSRTNTARQLERVLKWSRLGSKRHEAIAELIDSVIKSLSRNEQTLILANKLWLQNGFCHSSCNKFKKILQKKYDADIGLVDFIRYRSDALDKINNWVEHKTADKIKELLKPNMINSLTRLVITNAMYFKSNWKYKFRPLISQSFFTTTSKGKKIELSVPMMYLSSKFQYYQDNRYQVMELPYVVPEISMTIFLPRDDLNITISKLQQDFDMNFINQYVSKLKKEIVKVILPKFKMTTDLDLKDYLVDLGASDLFSAGSADLSGITGYRGLFVSGAVHKAFVDVSEKGTEAAASTAVFFNARTFRQDVFEFYATHPFLFLIRHKPSSAILFIGQVVKP